MDIKDGFLTENQICKAAEGHMGAIDPKTRAVAYAAANNMAWTIQKQMRQFGDTTHGATSMAWSHCAENLKLWLEMDGLEPWEK